MIEKEYYILLLAEECNEVAHQCSKILRFGFNEIEPGKELNNTQRLIDEIIDLQVILDRLTDLKILPNELTDEMKEKLLIKNKKIEKYLNYSRELKIVQ